MIDLRSLTTADTLEIWVRACNEAVRLECAPVLFSRLTASTYSLGRKGKCYPVELCHPEQQEELDFHLARGCARLACIESVAANGSMQVRLLFFSGELLEMDELSLALVEGLRDVGSPEQLAKDCRIVVEDEEYFLLLPGTADADKAEQFTIVGQRRSLVVTRQSGPSGDYLWIDRIAGTQPTDTGGIRLVHGRLHITRYADAASIRVFAREQLEKLRQEPGSYLRTWDNYCAMEGSVMLEKARHTGIMSYHDVQKFDIGSWEFFLDEECPPDLVRGDILEIVQESEIPAYLTDPGMSWEDYVATQDQIFGQKNRQHGTKDKLFGKVSQSEGQSVKLEMKYVPPASGKLIRSIVGDAKQMERRLKARQAVREGRSANPLLGLLIEENGVLPRSRSSRERIPALTPPVKKKIFQHDPTFMQEKAVEVALNTPDIALIQGPPGTGKTTVIAAIVERLNQLIDPAAVRGSILVSCFQHDAVENLVTRLKVNSLPTVKFGSKAGKDNYSSEAGINQWRKELTERLRARYPELRPCEQVQALREAFLTYQAAATSENERSFLNAACALPSQLLPGKLLSAVLEEMHSLKQKERLNDNKESDLLRHVHALRTAQAAYEDDGAEMAGRALIALDDDLDEEDRILLRSNPLSFTGGAERYFAAMEQLKERLFEKLRPESPSASPRPRAKLVEIMGELEKAIQEQGDGSGTMQVVADFLHDLENNQEGTQTALEDCNVVYAATVQQSENMAIIAAKKRLKGNTKGRTLVYDTVIVDEAARTSPMDLLIPMAQASKRIILVGDHKQLPHTIDEEVTRRLEDGEDSIQLKESMFAYLFRRLQKLTEQDGILRTVTLDAQYRMHPQLGNLVSRAFYEGTVQSPLGAELFAQSLEGTHGRPAMWLDVPCALGRESREGTSRLRRAEAEVIVRQLKCWMASEAGRKLTFGVISFYKAQTELIAREAVAAGLLLSADGQVAPAYEGEGTGERLRINTVDAFQGMEFDVVFLSMVRSVPLEGMRTDDSEKMKRRLYGHLMSENRLCVALSRQKRLLVLVGDSAMARHELGRQAVPALTNFLDLCETEGVVLDAGEGARK